jgi:hypothetical protein
MRLSLQAVAEDVAVGALEQAGDRDAQLKHLRCYFLVQPFLVIHRGTKPDRDHDEGLVLRRP